MKTINNKQYEECFVQAPVINQDNTINILTQKDSWSREEVIKELTKFSKEFNLSTEWREGILRDYISKNL